MSKRKLKALQARWHTCLECTGQGFTQGKICPKCGGLGKTRVKPKPKE